MDRGAWWVIVYGVTKELDTTKELNNKKTFYWYLNMADAMTPHIHMAKTKVSVARKQIKDRDINK